MGVKFSAEQVTALLGLDDGTVTIGQASAILGVSPQTVVRRMQSGEIAGYKYGQRSYRIPASEVTNFMAKSSVSQLQGNGDDGDELLTKQG